MHAVHVLLQQIVNCSVALALGVLSAVWGWFLVGASGQQLYVADLLLQYVALRYDVAVNWSINPFFCTHTLSSDSQLLIIDVLAALLVV
jgi:hypothetical protein